jgi:hypothetical protein
MRNNLCGWVRARLPLLAGGDWLGPDRRPVERHLIGCASCRQHLEGLRFAVSALRTTAAVHVPGVENASLWPALVRQIREARRPEPAWSSIWPRRLVRFGLAAAVLVALGSLGTQRKVQILIAHVITRAISPATAGASKPVAIRPSASPATEAEPVLADTGAPARSEDELGRNSSASVPDPRTAEPTH